MNNLVAKIFIRSSEADTTNMILYLRDLRFKCQRCASLCCKLGGPPLSRKDIDRIKRAGYDPQEFSESASPTRFELSRAMQSVMKDKQDGSCIFLEIGREGNKYECSIYDHRPSLCRLYPFYIETVGLSSLWLKIIPCCKGLNDPEGETVDEEFILRYLCKAVIDLLPDHPQQKSCDVL